MAMWRDTFMQVGGFDETLETCEDVDLSRRLRAGGMRVLHDPRLRSTHLGDPEAPRKSFAVSSGAGATTSVRASGALFDPATL